MPGTWSALRPSVWPLPKSCEACLSGLFMAPTPAFVLRAVRMKRCAAGGGAHQRLHRKLETGNPGSVPTPPPPHA